MRQFSRCTTIFKQQTVSLYTKKQWISLVLGHSSASEPVLFISSLFVSWLSVCCFEISVYPETIRMYCFALVKIPVLTKLWCAFDLLSERWQSTVSYLDTLVFATSHQITKSARNTSIIPRVNV